MPDLIYEPHPCVALARVSGGDLALMVRPSSAHPYRELSHTAAWYRENSEGRARQIAEVFAGHADLLALAQEGYCVRAVKYAIKRAGLSRT
jgi:hypothetical protein